MAGDERSSRDPPVRSATRPRLAAVGLVVAATALPLLRSRGDPVWHVLWAEDGSLYLEDLIADGPITPLLRGYGGYAQLPTRLLIAPAGLLPISWAAAYTAVVGAGVGALVGVGTYVWSREWIPSRSARLAVLLTMVVTPVAVEEVTANLVNLIWVYVAALPFALTSIDERRGQVVCRCLVVVAAATGLVVSLMFLPLAVAWVWYRRTRAAVVVAGCFAFGCALQLAASRVAGDATQVPPERSPVDLVRLVSGRVFAAPLVGGRAANDLWLDHGRPFLVGATVVVLVLFVAVAWGADRWGRIAGGVLAGHALLVFAFLALGRGTNVFRFRGPLDVFAQSRYTYVPAVLVVAAFGALASRRRPGAERSGSWARGLLLAHTIVVVVVAYPHLGYRGMSPGWHDQVDAARALCDEPGAHEGTVVEVPQDALHFFQVRMTCADLDP